MVRQRMSDKESQTVSDFLMSANTDSESHSISFLCKHVFSHTGLWPLPIRDELCRQCYSFLIFIRGGPLRAGAAAESAESAIKPRAGKCD